MTKAIKIDVDNHTVKEVEINDFEDINKEIGCDIFTSVFMDEEHYIYVDDMGLLKDLTTGFMIDCYPQPLIGNGIIVKIDDVGANVDIDMTVEDITARMQFVKFDESPEAPAPQIYPF